MGHRGGQAERDCGLIDVTMFGKDRAAYKAITIAMETPIRHEMRLGTRRDERARQHFVTGLRAHVLNNMASGMRKVYDGQVKPEFQRQHGREPHDGDEVLKAIRSESFFKFYSGIRCNAQEMSWRSVLGPLERQVESINAKAARLREQALQDGAKLELDADFPVPDNVSAIDVHLMPGCYHTEYADDDVSMGLVYDQGLAVFSMGMMGSNMDDIGRTVSGCIQANYPGFKPARILDMGCTIGHNTVPWAKAYPEAEVHGIDVAAPVLRYALARSQANGVKIDFHQQDATAPKFDDASFDLVFSSMFLHELPVKQIRQVFAQAYRLLRPGGLMLHMELPPNNQMTAFDGFYLDWDSYYNQEPFYKPFRDMDPESLCREAGFAPEDYVQFVMPSREGFGEEIFQNAVREQGDVDQDTGRLADGIHWFAFGAWKKT